MIEKKIIIKYLIGAITVVVLLWLIVSGKTAYQLIQRAAPAYNERPFPSSLRKAEKIKIITEDSLSISAALLVVNPNNPFVILAHGNGGDYTSNYLLMDSLQVHGINSLALSLRCHGSSDGDTNDFGYSAKFDIISAVKYLLKNYVAENIFIIGRSLGAAAAIFAAPKLGSSVRGYVLESPYLDIHTAAKIRLQMSMPEPFATIAYLGLFVTSRIFVPHIDEIAPIDFVAQFPKEIKVIYLAGGADERAPLKDVLKLNEKTSVKSEVVIFEGARHQSFFYYDKILYVETVMNFIRPINND